jgi:predicted ATPase/DNA-binding SARP family transcriptional activator
MQIGLLGPLEVRVNGVTVGIAGTRLRGLLTRLALDAGRPISAGALVDAVWGEYPPGDQANALQSLVSRLRRSLGDAHAVQPSAAGYRLLADPGDVDVHQFQRLAADGAAALRRGDPATAEPMLRRALALWRGPALADCADAAFAAAPIARLDDLRLAAMADRLAADLALARAAAVVAELEALTREHPLDERFAGLLIKALRAEGRTSEALAAYQRLRQLLVDELGVDPTPELQELHLSVLRGDQAPLSSTAGFTRRTNLRATLTSFVGRDEEAARIVKLLDESRLVTLVGTGGSGKTRLATEAASSLLDDYDAIWLVELAPVTDPAEIPYAVLASIGRRDATTRSDPDAPRRPSEAVDELRGVLTARRAMLVVDNCEHLLDGVAQLVDTLLADCPQLAVLATSREPLAITGEALVVLAPLPVPALGSTVEQALASPAVQLFADRGAAARPEFGVSEVTVDDSVEIVRRLDGLPLAIELAAARLRTLPVHEIAARLSDRFRLLTGGSRTALPRHRTLRAVVEWSWDLLSPAERLLAERLAVFPAGATTASAGAVCAGGAVRRADIPDLLAALVDKSLLGLEDDGPRYRMLETIREFGIDRLAERGELDAVRTAHARFFADLTIDLVPQLRDRRQRTALRVIAAEHDNVLAALRHLLDRGEAEPALTLVVALNQYWGLTGRHTEALAWLELALRLPGEGIDPDLWLTAVALRAMNRAITAELAGTDPGGRHPQDEILEILDDVLALDVTDTPMLAIVKPFLLFIAGEHEKVADYLSQALVNPDPWIQATSLAMRARFAENSGDVVAVRADTAAAIAGYEAVGDQVGLASVLPIAAGLLAYDGDVSGAAELLTRALRLLDDQTAGAIEVDDRLFILLRLSDMHGRLGEWDAARGYAEAASEMANSIGSAEWRALTAVLRGGVLRASGDVEAAQRLQTEAEDLLSQASRSRFSMYHGTAVVAAFGAAAAIDAGDLERARHQVDIAYTAGRASKDMPIVAIVVVAEAMFALAYGDAATASFRLGLAARIRGADDPTDLMVARITAGAREVLGADGFQEQWSAGWAASRTEAIDLADPGRDQVRRR